MLILVEFLKNATTSWKSMQTLKLRHLGLINNINLHKWFLSSHQELEEKPIWCQKDIKITSIMAMGYIQDILD